MADEEQTDEKEEVKGSKKKLIMMIVAALVVLGGAGGGAMFFMGGSDEEELAEGEVAEEVAPVKDYAYLKLEKPIVVNYKTDSGKTRFLKAEITLMTEDESGLDSIEKHLPKIQHTVSVVFGRQKFESLLTNEGKEAMRLEALTELQEGLKGKIGEAHIDDMYYTTFVTQ